MTARDHRGELPPDMGVARGSPQQTSTTENESPIWRWLANGLMLFYAAIFVIGVPIGLFYACSDMLDGPTGGPAYDIRDH